MAYREFHVEKTYAAPEVPDFLDDYTRSVSDLFQNLSKQAIDKRKNADQFSYDLTEGKFENDQKILNEYANNVVNRGRQDIMNSGRTSNETLKMMQDGKSWQQQSAIQFEKAKALNAEILARDAKDPYYDGQIDLNKLKSATNGDDGEVNFYTRGQRLGEMEKSIGGLDSFKYNDYRADYVKKIGSQYKEATTGNPNSTKTIYDQAAFWDNGKPGVSDQQAVEYINSDPQGRVDQFFTKKVNDQLDNEIKSMKSSGDVRNAWMKDKTDAEIKNELINDPSLNTINQKDFGVRKRELAKADLREADRINSKVSVEYKADKNTNGGLYKNDNIVHSYSFNTSSVQGAVPGSDVKPATNPGPGGVLFQKNGKPLQFNSTNPVRTNVNTGVTNKAKIGSVPFNLTGYQLQLFKTSGAPITLNGGSADEMIASINALPNDFFDPNGSYKPQPKMSVALQGYTVNQANVLNAANNQEASLQSQIADAQAAGDDDKVGILEMQLYKTQQLKALIGSGIGDDELSLAASRSGIKGVQVNEVTQASDTDLANIKAITQGFDLKDKNYWNDDMRRVSEAYEKRYAAAQASGFKSAPEVKPKKAKTVKSSITPEEFNAKWSTLKSGETLVGPDGVTYTKQ